ncbi:MAG: hypothetical protein ACYC8T_36300 [Myxococcaceae bacterium]
MRCRTAQRLTSRELDGRLMASERDGWQRHLDGCAPCRAFREGISDCWAALDGPTAAAPNLWPAIAARLDRPRPWGRLIELWRAAPNRMAVAVSVVLMVGAGMATGVALSREVVAPAHSAEALAFADAFGDLPAGMPDLLGPAGAGGVR